MRCLVLWGAVALFSTGCASLPAEVVRIPSSAIAGSTSTTLGRIATVSAPDAELSGFRLLPSGMFALDTRLELARRSQSSLDLQYCLIQADSSGRAFLRALRNASQRGVRVRLLLDDLYTAGQDALLLGLAAYPNVEVRLFNPLPAGRDAVLTRFATSLFQFERVNHRMAQQALHCRRGHGGSRWSQHRKCISHATRSQILSTSTFSQPVRSFRAGHAVR